MLNRALRLIRVYHDLSQTEVAARVGLSKSYISDLEAGNKKVTLEVLEKYSSAFEIPVSSLMLFAERTSDEGIAESGRSFVAAKILKMLEWLTILTEERNRQR